MTLWLTSDTHFGHASVIAMCDRPFADVEEMDAALTERWNALVRPRDTVWHLGDFSLGPKGTAERRFRRLNGSIHLVRGNHDGDDVVKGCAWASVQRPGEPARRGCEVDAVPLPDAGVARIGA